MPSFDIHPVDVAILLGYVLGTRVVLGWWFARKTKQQGAEGYFLAGRGMRWPIIGLSFYVANMSGSTFVALPGSGYLDGIAVYNYEWVPALLLVFFAVYLLPLFLRSRLYTAPQFLERRFGRSAQLGFAAFLLLANIFIDAAAALYAGAMVAQVLVPEIPLWAMIAVTSLIAGIYIAFGGLGAVVLNDAIQAALIIVGGATISWLAFQEVGSWEAVRNAAPEQALHLIRPVDDALMPWPGIFTGVLVIGFYFWCTNQFVIQRALAARSLADGRKGALFAGMLKLPNLFLLILPGLIALQLYPDLETPDLAFPTLAFELMLVGIRGLIMTALIAAIMSSLDSAMNSASTLFVKDFWEPLKPDTSEAQQVWIGRLVTGFVMIFGAIYAPMIGNFESLFSYFQSSLSYIIPPIVVVYILGLFVPWLNGNGAI
jgi:SSS family solute:Na+ symporter